MDQITDAMKMVDHISHPAFCVTDGIIIKANPAALSRMIEPGTQIAALLETGSEEYAQFSEGCLYLTLFVCGQSLGFSVSRKNGFDLFLLESDSDNPVLRALALAARELREPLGRTMISSDRLFPSDKFAGDPEISEHLGRINRGLYQLQRIIGNMSDANRYAAASASRKQIRNICGILDEIFQKAAALVEQADIRLEYAGLPEAIDCLVDEEILERAILNIVSNAIKFAPEESVIRASVCRRGNKLYLSIHDTGSIDTETLHSDLFSRYTRDPGVEEGRFGIGLGYVIICSAATLHGGTVLIDRPGNCGTRITLSLAISCGAGNQLRSTILTPDYAGGRDHALLELSDILPSSLYDPKNIN